MNTIGERVKDVRKSKGLSQTAFGEVMSVGRDVINNIENGRVEPKPLFLTHLCEVLKVSENWLKNGVGDMYEHSDDSLLEIFAKNHQLSDSDTSILRVFVELSPASRATLCEVIKRMAEALSAAAPEESEYERATRIVREKLNEKKDSEKDA